MARNRAAAAKSRNKKRVHLNGLEKKVGTLEKDCERLTGENRLLVDENRSLRDQLAKMMTMLGSMIPTSDGRKLSAGVVAVVACASTLAMQVHLHSNGTQQGSLYYVAGYYDSNSSYVRGTRKSNR